MTVRSVPSITIGATFCSELPRPRHAHDPTSPPAGLLMGPRLATATSTSRRPAPSRRWAALVVDLDCASRYCCPSRPAGGAPAPTPAGPTSIALRLALRGGGVLLACRGDADCYPASVPARRAVCQY
jgi:hypothetical protein